MGFNKGVKGYRIWRPEVRKVTVSRDVTFDESAMVKQGQNKFDMGTEKEAPQPVEIEEVKSQVETSPIAADGSDNSDADFVLQEVDTPPVEESIALNMPMREIRKPVWYTNIVAYALPVADDDIPVNFIEVTKSFESAYWHVSMDDEMQSL